MLNDCKFKNCLCLIGWHAMEETAYWMDSTRSIIIAESTCTNCNKEHLEFIKFDLNGCKCISRFPLVPTDHAKVECESTQGITGESCVEEAPKAKRARSRSKAKQETDKQEETASA